MTMTAALSNDVLRRRIAAAREAKEKAHGEHLTAEALDALFAADGEIDSRRRASLPPGWKRCTRCKAPGPAATAFYDRGNGKPTSWCKGCKRAENNRRARIRRAMKRGGTS